MNTASQSDTPRTNLEFGPEAPDDSPAVSFARSLERLNTDKARLDKLENFYLNSDSDSWSRFLKEAATSGFRRVIDDTILPQPAPKEHK